MTTRNTVMLFPMLLVVFSPLGIDLFLPAIRTVSGEFNAGASQSQWTISIFVLALGLGQIPFGYLSDRFGRRPVALIGLMLFMLGSALGYYAQNIETFLIARGLQGISASMTTVCAFSVVRDFYAGDAASNKFSWLTAMLNIVPSLAPLIGAGLLYYWGWRSLFLFFFGLAGCVMAIVFLFFKESLSKKNIQTNIFMIDALAVLRVSESWLPGLICISGLSFIITYLSLAPIVLIARLGLEPVQFSLLFGLNALFIVFASLIAPKLNARLGVSKSIKAGLICLGLASAALFLVSVFDGMVHPLAYMAPVALGSIGFAFSFGNAQGVAMTPHSARIGTASGILGALQMSVASLGAAVIVAVSQGQVVLFGIVFLCVFMGLLLWSQKTWSRKSG